MDRIELERGVGAPSVARGFVTEVPVAADHDEWADDARLLISELVSNAVAHTASGRIDVGVRVGDRSVRCEVVDDDSEHLPSLRRWSGGERGHGLRLVDAIADRWGHDAHPRGKVVWFELIRRGPADVVAA